MEKIDTPLFSSEYIAKKFHIAVGNPQHVDNMSLTNSDVPEIQQVMQRKTRPFIYDGLL